MSLGPTPITSEQPPVQANPELRAQIERDTIQAIFGDKYGGDVGKAREGYWNQNKTLSEQAGLLTELSRPQAIPYQQGYQSQQPEDPFARIQAESLVPADALRQAIQNEARLMVRQELGPMTAVLNAREKIGREHPEFIQHEAEIVQFAASNPELNNRVQRLNAGGLPDEAMLTMLESWKYRNPNPSSPPPASYAAGALPGASAGAQQRAVPDNAEAESRQRLVEAIRYAQYSGDETAVWDEYYKDIKVQMPQAGR